MLHLLCCLAGRKPTPRPASTQSAAALVTRHGLDAAVTADERHITIAGYASLVDKESALSTTPSLSAFRYASVQGYIRVFSLVSIINVQRGLAVGQRLTTATARPISSQGLLRVCLYDVPLVELPALLARERRLRFSCVEYNDDSGVGGSALMFTEYSDEEYRNERLGGSTAAYEHEVGQWYSGRLYRSDLLPVPSYVLRCVRAHKRAGDALLANFLDRSFLGDGVTSLRAHLLREIEAIRQQRHVVTSNTNNSNGDRDREEEGCPYWSDEECDELSAALACTPLHG